MTLLSNEEFKTYLLEKSNLVNKTVRIAHHASKQTFVATVTSQSKYGITVNGSGIPTNFHLYYGSYHILEVY